MNIIRLQPVEPVPLDRATQEEIRVQLGPDTGEDHFGNMMEDIAVALSKMSIAYCARDLAGVHAQATIVQKLSSDIGFLKLRRIAGDVIRLSELSDGAALAAVTARLYRIGEQSLLVAWELDDVSI